MNLSGFSPNFGYFIVFIVILYLFWSPYFGSKWYNYFLFFPIKSTDSYTVPKILGLTGEDIYFKSGNEKLHAWYYKNPQSNLIILLSHGNGGNILYRVGLIEMLLESGVSVFAYDYQGYGHSSGEISLQTACLNGVSAYEYLTQHLNYSSDNIILYGESLGTGISTYISQKYNYKAIILQSGFSSLRKRSTETLPFLIFYPDFMWPDYSLDNLKILQKPHKPLLLIHGKLDNVVGFNHFENLYEYSLPPKNALVLEKTGHTNIYETAREQFINNVRNFINKLDK